MLSKIVNILKNHTEYPKSAMDSRTHLITDLGLNSYDVVSVVTEFEDAFDIEIPDKDIKKLQTIGDIVAYIESQ